jgi:YbbR domain-containing protein
MTGRAPAGEVVLALWRRLDLRRVFIGDWVLKTAALVVALFLWVAAVYGAPPDEVTLAYAGRVPVERPDVPAGYVLRAQLGDVGVKLRGPEDAVRSVGPQQIRATFELSALSPSPDPQEVKVIVGVSDDRVHVAEVTPATVSVRLERRTERVLAVQARLANSPPSGFQAAPATFRPQEVTVSGPESAVAAVAGVLATVLFGDAPVDLAQDVRPVPVDASGQAVEGVEVDPVAVHVTVPVQSSATTRTLPILWQVSGTVASGYWISRIATDPVTATVSGDRAAVAALDHIDTETIDVTGITAARTVTAALLVPDGTSLLGAKQATVTVTVVALAGTRPFPLVAIQPQNLGTGLAADLDSRTVDVIVAGTVPALVALGADSVAASVDLSGKGPGTYTLEVAVRSPAGTTVQSVQPARVTVTIRSTRTPAPSP